MTNAKRNTNAAAYVLCSCVLGVILMRVIVSVLPIPTDTYVGDIISTVVFSAPLQLLFFLTVPFCIYKFYGGRTVKQTLKYSSCGRFSPYFLLAIPIGIAVYFMTVVISSTWSGMLRFTGYTAPSGSPDKPAVFNGWLFALEVVITAVLPAVCEEFGMRGGLLTEAKGRFGKLTVIIMFGVIFGLFHQNIRQVFYTALFGALATYIVLETESLYPAMLVHFTNNFLSVYLDYAVDYGFFGGGVFEALGALPAALTVMLFFVAGLFAAALIMLMLYCRDGKKYSGKNVRGANARLLPQSADGATTVGDYALIIAMGVVAALTTLSTYAWGFYY